MNELIATIQFIGLCLFTTAVAPDERMNVLLPRIDAPQQIEERVRPARSQWPWQWFSKKQDPPAIEEHASIILFRDMDLEAQIGWQTEEYTPDSTYQYVRLDGETVTFHAVGEREEIAEKKMLPLPGLKPCCNIMEKQTRADERGTAAIVKIGSGKLTTCTSELRDERDNYFQRTDTQLHLKNGGSIVIWATMAGKPAKALVVSGGASVFIANLPATVLADGTFHEHGHGDLPHYEAYFRLLKHSRSCSLSNRHLDELRPVLVATATETPVNGCVMASPPPFRFMGSSDVQVEAASSECSNSQWP